MALSIGIPTTSKCVKVDNFACEIEKVFQEIFFGLKIDIPTLESDCLVGDIATIRNGVSFKSRHYDFEFSFYFDDQLYEIEHGDQSKCYNFFSTDIGAARSAVGVLMLSAVVLLIAKRTEGIIEDPSSFWVQREFSLVDEFLENVKVQVKQQENAAIERLAEDFYNNLNGPGTKSF